MTLPAVRELLHILHTAQLTALPLALKNSHPWQSGYQSATEDSSVHSASSISSPATTMKFIIIPLVAVICSTSTMAMFLSNVFVNGFGKGNVILGGNGFLNGNGFVKNTGFLNGFGNGLVKNTGFVNGFDNGLVKNTGFVNGFDNGLGLVNGLNNGLSVARINSVQTNFPNQVVATVEHIAALPVQPLPVASTFATLGNFNTFSGKFDH